MSKELTIEVLQCFFPNAVVSDIQYGKQLSLSGLGNFNVFNTGQVQVQGKYAAKLQGYLEQIEAFLDNSPKIFIDYAFKNMEKKDRIKALLESWGFEVLVMEDMSNGNLPLLHKLESTLYQADYGLVLLSADDQLSDGKFLPRPNVMLELGMLLAHLKDKENQRITLINFDKDNLEIPSDILGIAYMTYEESSFEADLRKELAHLLPTLD